MKKNTMANPTTVAINTSAKRLIESGKKITVTGEETTHFMHGAVDGFMGGICITYAKAAPKEFPRNGAYGAEISMGNAAALARALAAGKSRWSCTDDDGEPLVVNVR